MLTLVWYNITLIMGFSMMCRISHLQFTFRLPVLTDSARRLIFQLVTKIMREIRFT